MYPLQTPDINVVVVPRAISDNFKAIGIKKILTPGYLETILSPDDILFYKFLNSLNCCINKNLEMSLNAGIQNFHIDELTIVYNALIFQYGKSEKNGDFAKAMHRLVFENQNQYGHFLSYTVLGMEDNHVILGLTATPDSETDLPVVKSVADFITTFYEHYGLQSLSWGRNFSYLRSLVFTAI